MEAIGDQVAGSEIDQMLSASKVLAKVIVKIADMEIAKKAAEVGSAEVVVDTIKIAARREELVSDFNKKASK